MLLTVQDVLEQNEKQWKSVFAFKGGYAEFSDKLAEINEFAATVKGIRIMHPGELKSRHFERISTILIKITKAVSVYALEEKLGIVKQQFDYTVSDIKQVRKSVLLSIANNIYTNLLAINEAKLKEYGITKTDVTTLKSLINEGLVLISSPQLKQKVSRQHTQQLENLFREATSILTDKLDKLVYLFKEANDPLYDTYQFARKQTQYGIRYKKEEEDNSGSTNDIETPEV